MANPKPLMAKSSGTDPANAAIESALRTLDAEAGGGVSFTAAPQSDPRAAVAAADPERTIRDHLPAKPRGRTIVIGAGKGSAQMASAFEKVWDGPIEGVVVTRYGYGCETRHVEIIEASHPVPDAAGLAASKRLIETVKDLSADDLVIALVFGGGSAPRPSTSPAATRTPPV